MRHAFTFPSNAKKAVKEHIDKAIARIAPERYQQEATYIAALAISLEGVAYDGSDGHVEFQATVVNDRGPNSAEKWSGADFAITATISDTEQTIKKAILIQAKLGRIDELPPSKKQGLIEQIKKMKQLTRSPKVMEITEINSSRIPLIISANRILDEACYESYELPDYFTRRVLTTFDGDTRPDFVERVQKSSLNLFRVTAKLTKEIL